MWAAQHPVPLPATSGKSRFESSRIAENNVIPALRDVMTQPMNATGGYEVLPFVADLYDHVPPYVNRPDVAFYVERAHSAAGPTLELGCGTGRVLIPTARAGCTIVGLDLSPYMLAKCREKLAREPLEIRRRVRLVEEDMTDFGLGETFALVTTPFRPFQHLVTVEEQLACLQCVNRHLGVGGQLIIEVFHVNPKRIVGAPSTEEAEDFAEVELRDGRKLGRTSRITAYHRARQVNDIELIYYVAHPDGRTERHVQAFPFRYFFRYEVEHLLARSGFRVAELYGGFDKSPFADDSPEMIFVAEKTEDIS